MTKAAKAANNPTEAPILMLAFANCDSRPLSRYQHDTATQNTAPITHDEVTVCRNLSTAKGDKATSAKLVISKRMVSGLKVCPTGYCIQALATSIHQADMVAPMPVSQVDAR